MLSAGFSNPILLATVIVLAAALGLLAWVILRGRQQRFADLEEQARAVAEEQEKTRRAQAEAAAHARDSKAKSEMLATLSRETRSHLNGIIGSADMLIDDPDVPRRGPAAEHVSTIRSAAESLHNSLNDVLEFADLESRKIPIEHKPFDLRQPLIEVIEQVQPVAALKGLELVLIVGSDVPPRVTGDAARLRQVMLNLVSNAVKFTAAGRVVLNVDLPEGSGSMSQQGATWLHFTVTDTGLGIPEEMQSTLFDRLALADPQSPRQFAGSGLGLAICERVVSLLGGRIGARGSPEGGAEFWVVLPMPAERDRPAIPPIAGKYAVVLDELAATRLAASALLTQVGVEHDVAESVDKAVVHLLEALREGSSDLVLLIDEAIARGSGAGVALALASEPRLAHLRIVLLARDPDSPELDLLTIPIVAVLRKPLLRPNALLDVLNGASRSRDSHAPFGKGANGSARSSLRVLVVDDDEISRAVTSRLLTRLGCEVELAAGGPAAIARARDVRFDVIFMDCQMPGMDGFATTEVIRGAAGKEAPPIVAVTANATPADREKCHTAGMRDFIGKPVTRTELTRVLKRWAS